MGCIKNENAPPAEQGRDPVQLRDCERGAGAAVGGREYCAKPVLREGPRDRPYRPGLGLLRC